MTLYTALLLCAEPLPAGERTVVLRYPFDEEPLVFRWNVNPAGKGATCTCKTRYDDRYVQESIVLLSDLLARETGQLIEYMNLKVLDACSIQQGEGVTHLTNMTMTTQRMIVSSFLL